jgi:hypothetical protein
MYEDQGTTGFAHGWTCFLTQEGLDVLLRTEAGESKCRLGALDGKGNLVGAIDEPGTTETPKSLALSVAIVSNDLLALTCGKRTWQVRRPRGKEHFFAFLSQWPSKAEPAGSVSEMLAALKAKSKAKS